MAFYLASVTVARRLPYTLGVIGHRGDKLTMRERGLS
jgi:hypothetical protein